jgi:hypothetical protein
MNIEKLVMRTAVAVWFLCIAGIAQAQQAWDTNLVSWEAPTLCVNGLPVSQCPVTGYRVERAPSSSGTFAQVGTSTGLTFTHTGAAAGVNCYRIIALSVTGNSGPSMVACKTNTAPIPPSPPQPPGNVRVAELVAGVPFVPVYRANASLNAIGTTVYGFVPTARACGKYVSTWRGKKWHLVAINRNELWATTDPANLAAPCA